MVNAIRKALDSQHQDICTIYELESKVNEVTGKEEGAEWEPVHIDIACKLSSKGVNQVDSTEVQAKVIKVVKLFIAPELIIKPGSRIEVTHNDRTEIYRNSGKPAVYTNHQEVALEVEGESA